MKWLNWFKKLGHALLTGLRRFPAGVLLSMAITVVILILNHRSSLMSNVERDDWTRALMVMILGFPMALGLHLLLERGQKPPAYKPAGLLTRLAAFLPLAGGLVAYAWYLLPQLEDVPVIRLAMLTAAAGVLFVIAPYWWRRDGLALHSTRLLTRLLVTVLYAGILMLSLFAILFTLENLLNVNIVEDHYADTATFVWALFAPLFFMAGIPGVREVPQQTDSPKTLRFLLHYILIPLIWVYTAILYAYSAKILIDREWPRGLVSSLILAYLCVGLLVWFLSAPIKGDTKLAVFHHRWFPWSAAPLFAILFIALFMRITPYGFTEERWFAFLLALWCAFAVAFLSARSLYRKRDPEAAGLRLIVLPLSLALLLVSSVAGPVSAFQISIRSQNNHLERLLTRNGMLQDGKATAAPQAVSREDAARMASILYWFEGTHSMNEVRSLSDTADVAEAAKRMNLDLDGEYPRYQNRYVQLRSQEEFTPLAVGGFDLLYEIGYNDASYQDEASGLVVRRDQALQEITVRREETILARWDMDALFTTLTDTYGDGAPLGEIVIPATDMTFDASAEGMRFRLVLRRLSGSLGAEEDVKDGFAEGILLVDLP
jgi:hypothetical protein